jgi:hypothetical protein
LLALESIRIPILSYEGVKSELTHLALQWTGEELQFFVNGKLDTHQYSTRGHSETPSEFVKRLFSEYQTVDLKLGAPLSKGSDGQLASNLYNVRISEGVRYTKQFKPEVFTKEPQTKLLYDFSEGQGNVLKDSSGNGYDGEIIGAKWVEFKRPRVSKKVEHKATESKWLNLLPLIDPALDADGDGDGGKFESEELVIGHRATLTLPVIPRGDYEIRAEFTSWNGPKYLHVLLPIGERNPSVVLASNDNETGYQGAGLQLIDGFSVADSKNSTRQTETFLRPNEKQTFLCRVISKNDHATITATVDGKTIADWSGSTDRLNKPDAGKSSQLKIWCYKGMLKLHSLELRMLNGEVQYMRPKAE